MAGLAGVPLYRGIGYGWGNTLMALLNIVCELIPITLYLRGDALQELIQRS